jgi:hypothetical protein
MENLLNVLWALFWCGGYVFICHRIAKRGYRTGLYYRRALVIALLIPLPAFIYFYAYRKTDGYPTY